MEIFKRLSYIFLRLFSFTCNLSLDFRMSDLRVKLNYARDGGPGQRPYTFSYKVINDVIKNVSHGKIGLQKLIIMLLYIYFAGS